MSIKHELYGQCESFEFESEHIVCNFTFALPFSEQHDPEVSSHNADTDTAHANHTRSTATPTSFWVESFCITRIVRAGSLYIFVIIKIHKFLQKKNVKTCVSIQVRGGA